MIGRRCVECLERLELSAADGQDVCGTCALDLRLREAFDRGWRGGWAAAVEHFGLTEATES